MKDKTKSILFRADSSSKIGTGHIMRDLVLATQYKDSNIIFATQNLSGNINHKIFEAGYKLEILQSNQLKELNQLIQKYNADMLVIDHYEIDYKFEKKLKENNPQLILLSFDDTYEKHYCDILLNHNISADKKRYKDLVPKNCELRCGSQYTLLRDEFYKQKKKRKQRFKTKNSKFKIFLAMGGADHSNITRKILNVLESFDNIKTHVVTTSANKNLHELRQYIENKKWVKLYIDSDKIAKLMKKSDFAIISPSVTANEASFMNLPFIAVKTADNQNDMYQYLKRKKYLVLEQFNIKNLNTTIKNIIQKLDKHNE
ncbi:UDP-2,4-diacetamido-2,4,6-trideoxy-beta-L-altropyranose hydrolase [Sulfurimonas autotrophica]|uniref:Pseudaminic acid biosynthesis-associated protein PseG n=1 Tax=Sulfurimonas autotrophica (strain ATCC BAA-671 / DSM 16294 / JCM 11897 / OK10) TaxID=563040 RepID=E0UT86_SULAO|nr:UDP-2,4-diacetamido-2,4,6-trideoxy-beta-L-altropyranose hydrolase [Sulfurimonas autotrophica]ADN08189.1 pseudaminic acid biosynthesis-associated protein PseG [Sulfurimonas autotrophica DSM 16294]